MLHETILHMRMQPLAVYHYNNIVHIGGGESNLASTIHMIQNITQISKMDLQFILYDTHVLNRCVECEKIFERSYDYYRHMRTVHGGK